MQLGQKKMQGNPPLARICDLHDLFLILLEDLLELLDLVALVRHHKIIHRSDFRVLLVRLDFWCLENVSLFLRKHLAEDEVLETLDALLIAGLVVIFEGVEEAFGGW